MEIAKQINADKPQNISNYYKEFKLNEAFGSQYGLTPQQVEAQIAKYGALDKNRISTL